MNILSIDFPKMNESLVFSSRMMRHCDGKLLASVIISKKLFENDKETLHLHWYHFGVFVSMRSKRGDRLIYFLPLHELLRTNIKARRLEITNLVDRRLYLLPNGKKGKNLVI